MLILITKSQSFLFDAPVRVAPHVRKDGVVVQAHTRIQKVAQKQPPAQHQAGLFGDAPAPSPKRSKLDKFIASHGGHVSLAAKLAQLTAEQQEILFGKMAELDGLTVDQVRAQFAGVKPREKVQGDLFEQAPVTPEPAPGVEAPKPTTEKEAAALLRAEFKRAGLKVRVDVAPGGGSVRVMAPAADKPLSEADQSKIKAAARAAGLTHVRGMEIDPAAPGDPLQQNFYLPGAKTEQPMRHGELQALRDRVAGGSASDEERARLAQIMRDQEGDESTAKIDHRPQALAQRRHDPTAPFGVAAGVTKAERRAINAKVAALVADGQTDLELMRQYSGNGGCGDSLNEFYTDPAVAAAQWSVIGRLGKTGGTALEPSCATGVYLHTAPEGWRVTGVELDPISSACAEALHGDRHEIRGQTSLERFARSDGGRQFDVVVGNPPYGPRGSLAKDDKPDIKTAEAYFIDTALDKTAPGGIVSLVVPASVLNNKNGRAFRERMLRKAEFLGAQRMPNSAFEASHTDVTADVIWLRKRPDDVAGALMTLPKGKLHELGVWDDEFLAGSYFEGRGKDNLLGTVGTAMRAYGEVYTVNGSMAGVPEAIAAFEPHPVGKTPTVHDIVAALGDDAKAVKRAMGAALVRPYADGKAGDTKVVDGITYVLQGKPLRWHRVDEILEHEAVTDAKPLAQMIERALAGEEVDNAALTAGVQAYIARHGIPVKSKELVAAADHDKVLHRLIGAVEHDGRLSDAVTGRQAAAPLGSIGTAAAVLSAEREDGTFTPAELAERSGKSLDEIEETLAADSAYAYVGDGRWTPMEVYLTGELWPKLDAARAAAPDGLAEKLAMQAKRLEETIAPKSLEDVDLALNAGFIPGHVIAAWLSSRVQAFKEEHNTSYAQGMSTDASVVFEGGLFKVRGGLWGDADLLGKYLNRTGVRQDDMPKVERLNDEFRQWLLTSQYRDEVEETYNRKFRGFVEPKWSEAPIEIPGLAVDKLKAYHYPSLRWALHQGKGIVADDVGLGKTVRGLMLARLAKMTGKAKKPTFVVPKSVLANWVAEAENWFPGSRVLVIGETYSRDKDGNLKGRPDTPEERNRKYHALTQSDYDFVFISQPAFNELDVDPITKGDYLDQDFWVQRGDALGNAGDKKVKRVREAYKQAVADREFDKRTDAIYFNHLGIDMLVVDEMHGYKNLYAARARFGESPKFLGGQGQSDRAFDMSFKAKWLRETNGGKGIYGLTATPTKNSPLEVYSMLSYVAPEEFEKLGIRNSEDFLDRYCVFKNENILGTNGEIDDALVTVGFKNLDELREVMARYIMRRTAKDVGLKLPEASQQMHLVDMTPAQSSVYGELRAQLAEAGKKDSTGDAHVFSIMDRMAKAAMDLELLDKDAYAGEESPKYTEAAKHIAAGAKDGGQVVFCESVDSHEKIAAALVAAGIPRSRIAILNAQVASSSAQRQNISDKFNDGRIDVVIGNKVMEEGVNLQKRTTDIHHLDTPWDPATLQQRNGRGVRQGNVNEGIRIHTYLARGSFDGYRYQSMRAKRDWMEMLWSGGDRIDNLAREGVFSRDDMMVMMSADPDEARAKLAADKEAAMQRLKAARTSEAAEKFVRFQSLKRSFNGLKNKGTQSAARLQMQLERAKTDLMHDKYFTAKGALDRNDEVLVHPASGEIIGRDMGQEVSEADGTTSRWVVTGVNTHENTVSMRPYADTTGHKGVTVPLAKLATGVKSFAFDADAEAAEVNKVLTERANAEMNSLDKWEQVAKMPSAVLEANHDLIQRQIKEHAKKYTGFRDIPYGKVPMVNKETGKVEMIESYEHNKKHDTHDYMLPTDANKEKAIQAWMDERRRARFTTTSIQAGRSRRGSYGNYKTVAQRHYPGADYTSKTHNPVKPLLDNWGGRKMPHGDPPVLKEAQDRFKAEQLEQIKRGTTASDVIEAAMPTGKIFGTLEDRTAHVKIPDDVLDAVYQRLHEGGMLDQPFTGNHSSYAYAGGDKGAPAHDILLRLANAADHRELVHKLASPEAVNAASAETARHLDKTLQHVATDTNFRAPALSAHAYRGALAAAERTGTADSAHMENAYGYGYGGSYGSRPTGAKRRDYLQAQARLADERAAAAAAKEAA